MRSTIALITSSVRSSSKDVSDIPVKQSGWFRLRYQQSDGVYLLLAAVLHDLGHYPCAHYLEDLKVFPSHEEVGGALIGGDLATLWLDTNSNAAELSKQNWESPGGHSSTGHSHDDRCATKHGPQAQCYLRYCNVDQLLRASQGHRLYT